FVMARRPPLPPPFPYPTLFRSPDTAALLKARAARFPTALRHVWQEDQGFRAGRARNLAIAASRGDYLLLIDGDMVLHPEFVADQDRKSTRLNSSHVKISYAVFC